MVSPFLHLILKIRGSLVFFQAEDGIRDYKVTGVQTCALPIFPLGTHTITLGFTRNRCRSMIVFRKKRSIFSVTSKSAITPSLRGRTARIPSGVRQIGRASCRERV